MLILGLKRLIRKSKGKRKNQIKHARRRFKQRFDISLNDNQYMQLINRIKNGKGEFVKRQSNRITIWDLEFEGELVRVVYDKKTTAIVTALYPEGRPLETLGERSLENASENNINGQLVR